MVLNDVVVEIGKPDGICSSTFIMHEFSGHFYIHQSFLLKPQDLHA